MKTIIRIYLGLIAALWLSAAAVAEPVLPGFDVELYAEVPLPAGLAFDPSGVLYVGNGDNLSGPVRIYRVGLGGSPVELYGDTGLVDPDNVTFDASGGISGTPGSVLVSGDSGDDAYIVAIRPDQSTVTLFSGPPLGTPQAMVFDKSGRLIIASGSVLAATNQTVEPLIGVSFSAGRPVVDGAGRIYFAENLGPPFDIGRLRVISPDGTVLVDSFATVPANLSMIQSPFDSVWNGDLLMTPNENTSLWGLVRVDSNGQVTIAGEGFRRGTLAFGPDSALYVGIQADNAVYRITPAEELTVSIDISPGNSRNPINPSSKGRLKIAILTTDEFDASTVDVSTVHFGTGAAEAVWYRLVDIDDDGDMDLALKFNTQDTGIACGDTEATLTGNTFDGVQITGTDSLKTVGCR